MTKSVCIIFYPVGVLNIKEILGGGGLQEHQKAVARLERKEEHPTCIKQI